MEEKIEQLARLLDISKDAAGFLALAVAIFLFVWLISWLFLPFSVWSISSKLTTISDKASEIRASARSCVEGIDRVKERIDGLAGRLDRIGRGPSDKGG